MAQAFTLTIVKGRNLLALNWGGTDSDPYIKFNFAGNKKKKGKTAYQKGTLNPSWYHTFDFDDVDVENDELEMKCLDYETVGKDKPMGTCTVKLADLYEKAQRNIKQIWVPLTTKKRGEYGEINLEYMFDPPPEGAINAPEGAQNFLGDHRGGVDDNNQGEGEHHGPEILPSEFFPMPFVDKPTSMEILIPRGYAHNHTTVFLSGGYIDAYAVITVSQPWILIRRISAKLCGKVYKGDSKLTTFLKEKFVVLEGDEEGERIRLERGKHRFPFKVYISGNCLSSVYNEDASVKYKLYAETDVVYEKKLIAEQKIKVVNMSQTLEGYDPKAVEMKETKRGVSGVLKLVASMNRDCVIPFDDILINLDLENKTRMIVKEVKFKLMRKVKVQMKKVQMWDSVVEWERDLRPRKLFPNTDLQQTFVLEVPKVLHSFEMGRSLSVKYILRITVDIPGEIDLTLNVPVKVLNRHPNEYIQLKYDLFGIENQILPGYVYDPHSGEYYLSNTEEWTPRTYRRFMEANQMEAMLQFLHYWNLSIEEGAYLRPGMLEDPVLAEQLGLLNKKLKKRHEDLRIKDMLYQIEEGQYYSNFVEAHISMEVLPSLTKNDFIQCLNLPVGTIYKIMFWIQANLDPDLPKIESPIIGLQ
eukprot:TRINITY_DN10978_c0_g1_i1.p1 TRINITY_DN10978_c0_g1~~TRINITY_DN10978_c0_g1_i1.p1  ORF type:complete len:641 (+),score=128.97 TRINITY_DN10978_c0_g1_i1:1973-3895(+)